MLALIGYAIYTQVPAGTTTAQVAEIAKGYSHEIGYVILGLAIVVVAVLIYKGRKKQ